MNKKVKIVLVTSGQPSTNPRAVKEAISLSEAGSEVTFIYKYWVDWAMRYDEKITKENPSIHWVMTGAHPFIKKGKYYFTRLRHKIFRFLNKFFPENIFIAQNAAISSFSRLLKSAIHCKADLYIAHNLGALPAAAIAAKKNNAKYGFDAEDYHRGQELEGSIEQKRIILLEDKYLPNASYITAASFLISQYYSEHYNRSVTVINNAFSKKYLARAIKQSSKPIKLFWFSQTIGEGRGLEDIILAMKGMPSQSFQLTLIGKHDDSVKNNLYELSKNGRSKVDINFMHPVSEAELFKIAGMHDIGLALETGKDINNGIALSNKIFTYLLAGNAIIFSDTPAQRKFYEENREVGMLYRSGNVEDLKELLSLLLENLAMVDSMKKSALHVATEKYNWETESKKFTTVIKALF